MTSSPEKDAWFQQQLGGRSIPNPPALDGSFAPPVSPLEAIRILRTALADATETIRERDLQLSALRHQLAVAQRERDAALEAFLRTGATITCEDATDPPAVFPARALRAGDGIMR